VKIVAFPREERMIFHMKDDVQISGRSTELPHLAGSRKADTSSVFNTRGDLGFDCSLAQQSAVTFTFRARIGDHATATLASWTRARNAEKSLLVANLAASVTGAAARGTLTGSRTGTVALFAGFVTAHRHFRFRAKKSLFELESQVFAKIGATLRAAATASSAATAEDVAKTEKLAEYVAEVLEDRGVDASTLRATTAQPGVPIAVVDRSLFGVREDGVGFAYFFKFVFGIGVIRIAVGMVLQRQLAVRAFKFGLGNGATDA
jgi:hypothetical protein